MKAERLKIARMCVLLIATAWLASNAGAQTAVPSSLHGTGATALSAQQTGCVSSRLFIGVGDGQQIFITPADKGNAQSLSIVLVRADTCTNQILMFAKGVAVLPHGAFQFDSSFGSAAVQASVEMLCQPGSPPCDPFPVEVNLTWTGVGDITRFNAGVGGNAAGDGDIIVCPSQILDKISITGATRAASLTGDVTANGTNLLQGLILFSLLVRTVNNSISVVPNGAAGPPFCLCSNPPCL
jgi:hypothetical protein